MLDPAPRPFREHCPWRKFAAPDGVVVALYRRGGSVRQFKKDITFSGRRVLWLASEHLEEDLARYREEGFEGVSLGPRQGWKLRDIKKLERLP